MSDLVALAHIVKTVSSLGIAKFQLHIIFPVTNMVDFELKSLIFHMFIYQIVLSFIEIYPCNAQWEPKL